VLHAATIEVPSGVEHPPRAPVAPRAPRGERGTRRRLLRSTLAAAAAAGEATVAPPPWWRGSRDARIYLIHIPDADARVILRDVMRDRGEIAGYVPSSAYLCVVRDPSVAAELDAVLPSAWLTELKPHHKISPNLVTGDDDDDDDDDDDTPARDERRRPFFVAAYPPPAEGADVASCAADARSVIGRLGSSVEVTTTPQNAVLLSGDVTAELISRLAQRPWTHWIERRDGRVATLNMQTSAVIQSGRGVVPEGEGFDPAAKYAVPPGARENRGVHPVWRAGIRGENVLVGVGDSGLDVRSCWLADPENDDPGPRHRKIRRYNAVWGDEVDSNGHGTHVVSTILGEAARGSPIGASEYDGMAPRARVVFNDIGVGAGGSLFLPTSMAAYFDTAYADGARIHSDSWGNDAPLYDGLAREVDEYAWSHRDFLPFLAAGNFGLSAGAPSTVTSPATCKNGVAVGASLGWSGPNVVDALAVGDSATMRVRSRITGTVEAFTVYMAAVGADRFATGNRELRLVAATPPDGCSSLTGNDTFPGAVVLVTRGGCYFSDKIIHAQDAGAVGVIVANDDVTGFFKIGARDGDPSTRLVRVPAASVPASSHRKLLAAMPCVVTFHPARPSPNRVDHIASFSSFGPTEDGRFKPDVVAPGEITSAAAAGEGDSDRGAFRMNCAVTRIAGTSMATPVAAGAAALVRQYFTDGFYPTGERTPRDGFEPTSALVKAALINGCEPMRGFTELGLPLEPPPSVRQGHGRVHVGRSLPLAPGPARMFAVDERSGIERGDAHSFCLFASVPGATDAEWTAIPDDAELRVTLVWTDPPASLPSAGPALVNDLDLTVERVDGDTAVFGGGDGLNNAERVTVPLVPGAASFVARVIARDVRWIPGGESGQPYALVATAPGLTAGPCGARELSSFGDAVDFGG